MSAGEVFKDNARNLRKLLSEMAVGISENNESEEEITVEDGCEILYILQELKRDVAFVIDELESSIAEKMEESIIFLPSGQQVERRTGADRKSWDHKGLANIVADRVFQSSIDIETGEVLLSPREMMTKMLDYAAPSYWRVKELDKLGISADAFCEKSEGKTSIVISKMKEGK
jgi:hypothetical protein